MKMRISINGQHLSIGEIIGRGHLGALISLNDALGSGEPKMEVFLSGYDTNNPEETKCLKWPNSILKSGDIIKIEMMPDEPADDPSEIKTILKNKT